MPDKYVRSLNREIALVAAGNGADITLPPGRPERPPIPASVEEAEFDIRNQDFETAHIWTADGTYAFGRNGGSSGVSLTDEEINAVKDALFVHNHPNGGAFSNADIHFIEDLNPREFRAVGPDDRFELRRPERGWPRNLHSTWFENIKIIAGRLKKDVDQGKMTEAERSRHSLLQALRKTVEDFGLGYTEGSK